MKSKRVNYKELLELINLDALEKNQFTIYEDGTLRKSDGDFISIKIPNEVTYKETESCVKINCSKWNLTLWKDVEMYHMTIF